MIWIALIEETQAGEEHVQDSVARALRFRDEAARFGVEVRGQYWTLGECDGVLILDAPDAATVTALLQRLTSAGAVRTRTMQAFEAEEMSAILERAAG
jgi:uncharacterized protein with GYD domain